MQFSKEDGVIFRAIISGIKTYIDFYLRRSREILYTQPISSVISLFKHSILIWRVGRCDNKIKGAEFLLNIFHRCFCKL